MAKRKKIRHNLTAADFFAGIGGLRLGFKKAGYRFVYANDNDKFCCQTYRLNFGEIDSRDIRNIDPDSVPDFDILLAGFPCQPFSMVGKRNGLEDDRGKLFFHIVRFLNAKHPKAFLLENVKHLLYQNGGKTFKRILASLEWAGYKVFYQTLNSKDFGVPQYRERLFIAGFSDHLVQFRFPVRKKSKTLKDILERKVDEFYYLSERYYRGLLAHKRRHSKSGNGFGCEIANLNGIARTLVAGNMGRERNLIRDKPNGKNRWGIRRLTIRECARLQGFPDSFKFPVSITQAYKQLGNAVTVTVAETLAKKVARTLVQ
ncbi:MAG: DNA (cytosine-5-)-methyltransferase [Candidatus Tagabacteria bacterium CG_4_8_14_3_um_filter_41_8]|uniref:Cytosine-specific methyltransferase n=1 Tax=Candidatus Tagabacteria bacterium CG_4_8_14_3_um_filter_41_8 TaxID=1975018 RepID=A0A2M8G9M2_9BACT|nr:MAG: DNA (cytosine-5-)-methyltransferase [Candidatus Tagabacteria bacterium CG_4_8_14_3_um_filter_41_8]